MEDLQSQSKTNDDLSVVCFGASARNVLVQRIKWIVRSANVHNLFLSTAKHHGRRAKASNAGVAVSACADSAKNCPCTGLALCVILLQSTAGSATG